MDITPVVLQFPTIESIYGAVSKFSVIPTLRNASRISSCLLLAYYVNDYLLTALPPPQREKDVPSPPVDVETSFFSLLKLLEISAKREVPKTLILPQLSQITHFLSQNRDLKRKGFRATQDLSDFKILFRHLTTRYEKSYKRHLIEALRLNLLADEEAIRKTLVGCSNSSKWIKEYKKNSKVEGHLFEHTHQYLEIYYQCPGFFQRLKRRINQDSEALRAEKADACRWILYNLEYPDCYSEEHCRFIYNCYQKLVER